MCLIFTKRQVQMLTAALYVVAPQCQHPKGPAVVERIKCGIKYAQQYEEQTPATCSNIYES